MATKKNLEALYDLIKDFDVATMTTINRNGLLVSRPMMTQKSRPEADLWFVTFFDSNKVNEVGNDPRVNISYYQGLDKPWVSVSGKAQIDRDPNWIYTMWEEKWRVWSPNGPNDPELAIVKIKIDCAVYWKPEEDKIITLISKARALAVGEKN